MAINSNNFQNQSAPNTLNAEQFYGIGTNTSCGRGECVSNIVRPENTLPTIQEIAAYSQQEIASRNPSNPIGGNSPVYGTPSNTMQQTTSMPMNNIPESLETPATVLNYGATIGENAQNSLGVDITDISNPYPVTAESLQYLNGFIRTQIGRRVSIDFLVGSNNIVTKTGYLLGVASNYLLLNELDTNDITTCDFYNIKFMRFYY